MHYCSFKRTIFDFVFLIKRYTFGVLAMDILKKASSRIVANTDTSFKRYLYDEVDFDVRLVMLKGSRGVGKTTLMLQYLKELGDPATGIFMSLDHIVFTERRLIDVVDSMYGEGYRTFALDEVHKYVDWSIELKNIYDNYPDIQMIVTASSALDIMKGLADLSRRADVYTLHGLSFREFLSFEYDVVIPSFSFDELIAEHQDLSEELSNDFNVLKYFKYYLQFGYYPFYKESKRRYHDRIRAVVNQVIEVDLPPIFSIDYNSIRQLKKLLSIISRIAPFTPNVTKLSKELGIGRNRVLLFLDYLDSAGVINLLKSARKSDSAMAKPDKIFLNNPNLIYALSLTKPNVGTLRETFFMEAVSATEHVSTPAKGDFLINDAYVAEVGGLNKNMHQIYDMPNPILVKDGVATGGAGVIPIWMMGLLY